eukprot:PhF_6_TR5685/c0_g1_i2/m.8383
MTLLEGLGNKDAPQHIDFLSIDAEGYDTFVLAGARDLFIQGRVSVVQFEIHMFAGPNPLYCTIHGVVSDLDSMGYECMLPLSAMSWKFRYKTHPRFTPNIPQYVTVSGCQKESLEVFKGWANVLCFYRPNATLRRVFQQARQQHRRATALCDVPEN